ncbi:MAG TPA: preprotein translocase subunit SecG [Catalimonadaceae bacterium]|jgi:preprotein translocase subunit SecG|nr:preprotein translocase subunit SecG [Catalimonadaceae bacterium]
MIFALITVIGLLAILMVLVILAQDSKSGALSSNFGASQVMGVKRTTDLLEKLTWGFMASIVVLTLSFKFLVDTDYSEEGPTSVNVERAKSKPSAPAPTENLNPTSAPDKDSAAK